MDYEIGPGGCAKLDDCSLAHYKQIVEGELGHPHNLAWVRGLPFVARVEAWAGCYEVWLKLPMGHRHLKDRTWFVVPR